MTVRLAALSLLLLLQAALAAADGSGRVGRLLGANFNSTADQAIAISPSGEYVIRRIIVANCSASITLAAGGLYTGAGKTGTIVVAAAQVYTALTGSAKWIDLTLASGVTGDTVAVFTLFLSLTTGQGSAATCDVHVFADILR
jgi:hypothetical protein